MTRNRYFLFMSTLFFAVVLVGFTRSLYFRAYFDFPELPAHLHAHGIALTAWFTLAFAQPWLIKTGRVRSHRQLGAIGAAFSIAVVVTGLWTVVLRDASEIDEFSARAGGNLASLVMFSSCVFLGFLFRRKPATHKRLMLFASISILAPALDRLARIPSLNEFWGRILYWFPAPPEVAFATLGFLFLLLTVVANDLVSERRVQSGTLWGLFAILIFSPAVTYGFMASGAWVDFVHWAS